MTRDHQRCGKGALMLPAVFHSFCHRYLCGGETLHTRSKYAAASLYFYAVVTILARRSTAASSVTCHLNRRCRLAMLRFRRRLLPASLRHLRHLLLGRYVVVLTGALGRLYQ